MTLSLRTLSIAALAALVVLAVAVASAAAIVPPRNCGTMKVGTRTFQVKADQIRCTTAKDMARRYIRSKDAPRGYRCRRGSSRSKLYATCSRTSPSRVLYIIRR